jgi:hypothetical protein
MSKLETPSITSSRGYASSHLTWVKTMQKDMSIQVWGRIKDTGANFIVEGWTYPQGAESRTEWVQIPCQNLATAQLHLGSVMDKLSFDMEQIRQRLDRAENDKLAQEILATI